MEHELIFDGRGGDIRYLTSLGIAAKGWDPIHRPRARRQTCDVVMLTFVLNVIEDAVNRATALQEAWKLTKAVLVVSARLQHERDEAHVRLRGDGWMTTRGTFQKFFDHRELGDFIQQTLHHEVIPATPGTFYLFRSAVEQECFLSRRFVVSSLPSYMRESDIEFVQDRVLLDELIKFFVSRGRLPIASELKSANQLRARFGSIAKAFRRLEVLTNRDEWVGLSQRRRVDLLVYLALKLFDGPYRMKDLSDQSQLDVRAHFVSLTNALELAKKLLYGVGRLSNIELACRSSGVGKLTPSALYFHVDAREWLPAILKVYEGCARRITGDMPHANIIKLSKNEKKVSYLNYPDFESDPHPGLVSSDVVNLLTGSHRIITYRRDETQPILHRKELFVHPKDPRRCSFEQITAEEERQGLYSSNQPIGTRGGWTRVVSESHSRTSDGRIPELDAGSTAGPGAE